MNHATIKIGNSASVASRLTSNNGAIRPEKLIDVEANNTTNGELYLLYFEGQTAAPANGTTADEGFAVQAGLGGTLGRPRDIMGGIFVWSSTFPTLTAAGASGSIIVLLKG